MSECTCGRRFLDAEDYRDHLPCEGTPGERRIRELEGLLTAEEMKVVFLVAIIKKLIEAPGPLDVERLRTALKTVTK